MSNNIISIPLSQIRVLPEVQSRVRMDKQIVADYRGIITSEIETAAEENRHPGYPFEAPLTVVADGDGYIVADGYHRVEAYKNPTTGEYDNPTTVVNVEVRPPVEGWTPVNLAKFHSSTANLIHGLHRSRQDKINAVMLHLQIPNEFDKSDRTIAKALRVHRTCHVAEARRLLGAGYTTYVDLPVETDQSDRSGLPADDQSGLTSPPQPVGTPDEALPPISKVPDEAPRQGLPIGNNAASICLVSLPNGVSADTQRATVITPLPTGKASSVATPPPVLVTPPRTADAPTPAIEASQSAGQAESMAQKPMTQGRVAVMRLREILQYAVTMRTALQIVPLPTPDTAQEYGDVPAELLTELQGLSQDCATFTDRLNALKGTGVS